MDRVVTVPGNPPIACEAGAYQIADISVNGFRVLGTPQRTLSGTPPIEMRPVSVTRTLTIDGNPYQPIRHQGQTYLVTPGDYLRLQNLPVS